MPETLSDDVLKSVLVAIGAEPTIAAGDFDRSFDDLYLDSLARAEFAAKLKERTKVDIEDQLSADTSPNEARRLLQGRLSAVGGA